jgi:hypothetical protein
MASDTTSPIRPETTSPDEVQLDTLYRQVVELRRQVSDIQQRLDTAQTHQWKRVWFWLQGWPMTDWNAERRNRRPWRRG